MQGASSVNSEMKKRLVKDFSNSLLQISQGQQLSGPHSQIEIDNPQNTDMILDDINRSAYNNLDKI